jgi:hypothetical protein
MNSGQAEKVAVRNASPYNNGVTLSSHARRKRVSIFPAKDYGSVFLKRLTTSPVSRPTLDGDGRNCKSIVFNRIGMCHRSPLLEANPSVTTTPDSRQACERCHGIGYVQRADGTFRMTTLLFTSHHSGRSSRRHAIIHKLDAKDMRTGLGELCSTAPSNAMAHPNYSTILFDDVATGPSVPTEQLCVSRNFESVECDLFNHLDSPWATIRKCRLLGAPQSVLNILNRNHKSGAFSQIRRALK